MRAGRSDVKFAVGVRQGISLDVRARFWVLEVALMHLALGGKFQHNCFSKFVTEFGCGLDMMSYREVCCNLL